MTTSGRMILRTAFQNANTTADQVEALAEQFWVHLDLGGRASPTR